MNVCNLDIVRYRFCMTKERNQRRNEKVYLTLVKGGGGNRGRRAEAEAETEDLRLTLSVEDWVRRYRHRRALIWGSAETSDKVLEYSYASYTPASERNPGDDGVTMTTI